MSFTEYDQDVRNDFQSYSFGPFADWSISDGMRLCARGGYTIYTFDALDPRPKPTTLRRLRRRRVLSRLTDSVNYRLTAVHRFQTGIQSAITERTDLRLNVRYAMSSRANWSATFLYSISDRAGTRLIEHYTLIGPDLTFNYRINQRLQASLGYRYRNRDSDLPGRNYDVNLVTLNVRYRL